MKITTKGGANYTELQLNGATILVSYKTPVAAVILGRFYKTEKKWSSTTSRHIGKFFRNFDFKYEDIIFKPQSFFDDLLNPAREVEESKKKPSGAVTVTVTAHNRKEPKPENKDAIIRDSLLLLNACEEAFAALLFELKKKTPNTSDLHETAQRHRNAINLYLAGIDYQRRTQNEHS